MSRYIDAEPLERNLARVFVDVVKAQPTADVVEVVRCKNCKWWDSDCGWCDLWGNTHEYKDGYCSYGEREDNE